MNENEHHVIPLLPNTKKRKVLVLGAPGTGKSSMIMRFTNDIFFDYYDPNMESSHKKLIQFDNENVELELIDIDGASSFGFSSKNLIDVHAYILSYSIENRHSFEMITMIESKIISLLGSDLPKIVVANKSDLHNRREISVEEGRDLAMNMKCPFIECSAKSNGNINKLFHILLVSLKQWEKKRNFNSLKCRCMIDFIWKHEKCLTCIFYFLMCSVVIFGAVFLISGFFLGIHSLYTKNIIVGAFLLLGLWDILFAILGIYGMYHKKIELMFYFSIGLFLSIILTLSVIFLHLIGDENKDDDVLIMKHYFFFIVVPLMAFFQLITLFFAVMFQNILNEKIKSNDERRILWE